jgi:putative spermidine/putrescine transport system substrate-binding protein
MIVPNSNRRQILAAAAASSLSLAVPRAFGQPKKLTIISWGGAYQAGQSKNVWQPAAAKLGIEISEETYNGLADLRLRVKSGASAWDIVSIGAGGAARAAAEDLLEPIDYKAVDVTGFVPGYAEKFWVAGDLYSTAITWNTKKYGSSAPATWADFWDVRRFPGARSYRNQALGHLEPALMADGVPMDKIYAELSTDAGLKHAIGKIAALKPQIAAFWASGAQQAQLIKDGTVDMASAWSGQIAPLAKAGVPVAWSYNQAILDADVYVVPKGTPRKQLAMQFLSEISKPDYQAAFSNALPYGAVNSKSYEGGRISADVAKTLPSAPANLSRQLKLDVVWWRENQSRAEKLYQEMIST